MIGVPSSSSPQTADPGLRGGGFVRRGDRVRLRRRRFQGLQVRQGERLQVSFAWFSGHSFRTGSVRFGSLFEHLVPKWFCTTQSLLVGCVTFQRGVSSMKIGPILRTAV